MHNPPSPPLSSLHHGIPQMDPIPHHPLSVNDEPSTSLLDWTDFLDFGLEDQFSIPLDFDHTPEIPPVTDPQPPPLIPASSSDNSDKVRKRDPRLVCSNFLAGRIPCACPELDAMLEEAESEPGKKRARTVRAAAGTARCQVPGCGADISELKGYHRRHRVCLHCANASAVVLEGQNKRYCQQCGKFHILSDFDEGKRSCRRKLERHNNRRRRKPADCKENVEKEAQQASLFDDGGCDNDTAKESTCLNSQSAEGGPPRESDGHVSMPCSADGSQNIHSDSIVSLTTSGETLVDEEKDKFTNSPPYLDDKSAFSSMCPTGRISFKLYDWNPAEFPRRLRHQIFQWLASMPVELEGYIRPGCTILTVFIAMPTFMWVKLFEDPVVYIQNLVASGNMLSGRGNFLVYLKNMIFHVTEGGASVIKVKVEGRGPKLHYVHPTCFEAGKPMEFVACGSNLLQPKFRFLLSFAGKYLKYDVCVQPPFATTNATTNLDHQLLKIYVPRTDRNHFGPAFIEVENESGLSNFIPILIGDKEICSEMKTIQQKIYTSLNSRESNFAASSSSCEASALRQKENSGFILRVAWLLKEPSLGNVEHVLNSSQLQRFNFILDFLIQNESTAILDRVLYYMKTVINNSPATDIVDTDMRLCQRKINRARDILCQNLHKKVNSVVLFRDFVTKEEDFNRSSENNVLSVVPVTNQDKEVTERRKLDSMAGLDSASVPLLNRDVPRVNLNKERMWPRKSCSILFTSTASTSRPLIFVIATTAVCFGICAAVLHPQKVGRLATTIHRCLFYNP